MTIEEGDKYPKIDWGEFFKATAVSVEDIQNLGDSINSIHKVGMKIPFSWEQFVDNPRQGHYEPVGIKWVQWLVWALGLVVFKIWVGTETVLRKFWHFQGVSGYEWEEAEYRPFKQKERWVEDE